MPLCRGLETLTDTSLLGILNYPTVCDYYFYAKILGAIFIVLTLLLFNREEENVVRGDMISCAAISSIATIFIAIAGSILGIIQTDILIISLVIGTIFIAIWIFKN